MSASPPPSPTNDQGTMMLMAIVLILIALAIFHSIFYYACCAMLYTLWTLADFSISHGYVAQKINLLAWGSRKVDEMTLGQFLDLMEQTAGILYVFLVPVTVYGLIATRNHPLSLTHRKINIYTLLRIMARFSPAIIPALQYGDPKTQLLKDYRYVTELFRSIPIRKLAAFADHQDGPLFLLRPGPRSRFFLQGSG